MLRILGTILAAIWFYTLTQPVPAHIHGYFFATSSLLLLAPGLLCFYLAGKSDKKATAEAVAEGIAMSQGDKQ